MILSKFFTDKIQFTHNVHKNNLIFHKIFRDALDFKHKIGSATTLPIFLIYPILFS